MSYTTELFDNEQSWLERRLDSFGGSEAAATVGRSKWSTPLGLYYSKTERRVTAGEDMGPMAEAGKLHEPTLARWFIENVCALYGWSVLNPGDYTIYRSTEREHITCTPDRLVLGPDDELLGELQLKCAWFDAYDEWKDKVPAAYQIQSQHSMAVLGTDNTFICVMGNGYLFRWFQIPRNQRFIDKLLNREDRLWAMIKRGEQPPAIWTDKALLNAKSGESSPGLALELDGEDAELAAVYDTAKAEKKAAEEKMLGAEVAIKELMGEAEVAVLPDGTKFSWKTGKKSRTFRRKV